MRAWQTLGAGKCGEFTVMNMHRMSTPRAAAREIRQVTGMISRRGRTGPGRRRGAAIVEFAVVAPLFFTLVMGMLEFGRAIMVSQICINASREGARKAALSNMTLSEVQNWTSGYLQGTGIPTSAITVALTGQTTIGGAYGAISSLSSVPSGLGVQVRVTVQYSQVSWVGAFFLPSTTNLSGTTIMRREL